MAQLAVTVALPELPAAGALAPDALAGLGRRLHEVGFELPEVLAHTRASVFAGIPLAVGAERLEAQPTPRGLAALIELLVCGEPVAAAEVEALLGAAALGQLCELGLVARLGPRLMAVMAVVPVALQSGLGVNRRTGPSLYVVHDRHQLAAEPSAVMPPDTSSETLLRCAPAGRRGPWLDVGTGSGVTALAAARGGAQVVAVDINPRAVAATRLGAALNGLALEALVSDLTRDAPRRPYQVVSFNAPLMFGERYPATWRSAPEGVGLMTRFLGELSGVLADDAAAEALVHGQLAHDDRLLIDRLAPLEPTAWRALSVRYHVDDDHAQGMLWLARGGDAAWSLEEQLWLSLDQPFVDRALLEARISQQEMPGARRA